MGCWCFCWTCLFLLFSTMFINSKMKSLNKYTYQPWNQKFRYFFYLLNPSVRTKTGLVLRFVWQILLETMLRKVLEIWKYHSTHFIFLSEVQHISTCSNNVCPYAKEKKKLYTNCDLVSLIYMYHSSVTQWSKLLTKVWSTDSTYQIDFLIIC